MINKHKDMETWKNGGMGNGKMERWKDGKMENECFNVSILQCVSMFQCFNSHLIL